MDYFDNHEIKKNVVIGLQVRYSSTRLPGKALLPFMSSTILGATIHRCIASGLKTYILTSSNKDDDLIEDEASKYNISGVIRGSLENVLSRYKNLAEITNAKFIVRVTGDNPFTDSKGIINLVKNLNFQKTVYLRHAENELPIGYHSELFSTSILFRDFNKTQLGFEHVTHEIRKIYYNNKNLSLGYNFNKQEIKELSCSVDTIKDYKKALKISSSLDCINDFKSIGLTNIIRKKINNQFV